MFLYLSEEDIEFLEAVLNAPDLCHEPETLHIRDEIARSKGEKTSIDHLMEDLKQAIRDSRP